MKKQKDDNYIQLDVLSELNTQRRLYRHLIEHGIGHSLAHHISNGYKNNANETNKSWLIKLIDSLLTFTKEDI